MMAATPTKLSSEADVGRSKAQHVVILAFCSKIAGITYSASPNTALDPRLGAKTGLNDEVFVNKLTASVPNGKCQMTYISLESRLKILWLLRTHRGKIFWRQNEEY